MEASTYGVDTIVGESVLAAVPESPALELDLIRVKGKSIPVRIYALLEADRLNGGGDFDTIAGPHAEMIAAYRRRDWAVARARRAECEQAGRAFGLGDTYALYAKRFDEFESDPPDADWDGVYEALSK